MIKIVFIVGLILVGLLAAKFVDEKMQKKITIVFTALVAVAVLSLVVSELIR